MTNYKQKPDDEVTEATLRIREKKRSQQREQELDELEQLVEEQGIPSFLEPTPPPPPKIEKKSPEHARRCKEGQERAATEGVMAGLDAVEDIDPMTWKEMSPEDKEAWKHEKAIGAPKYANKTLTPQDMTTARRQLFNIVQAQNHRVKDVLAGRREWSNQQVNLYGKLLNKVLPDLKQTHTEIKKTDTKLEDMSVEDLEAIVSNAQKLSNQIDAEDENIEDGDFVEVQTVTITQD